MTPEQWQRAERVFGEARGLAPGERAALLERACAGDAELRAEVESLLAHHDAAGEEFLAPPIRGFPAESRPDQRRSAGATVPVGVQGNHRLETGATRHGATGPGDAGASKLSGPAGESIEGYQITREIHRGGQGVVYQAIQLATKRKVALKVLLEGPFASEKSRHRFEREIELVASLHHPNIVAVHDSGIAHGKYWFAMDYVRGKPLDEWVRARSGVATDVPVGREVAADIPAGREVAADLRVGRRPAGTPDATRDRSARRKTNAQQIDETLKLFAKICNAVNYAHQRGVIHRDLKPGNILVDEQGEPRVLDFGLAKVLAAPDAVGDSRPMLVSVTGQVMGTLPYMSPEQARGDPSQIDIRTDVYSLGVILYELLTGQYPYEVVGHMADVLRNIAEAEPKRPSKSWVASGLRAGRTDELDTIVLKALAKEPARRYQSAGHLAEDLQRFMTGEPIEAKRDSAWYVLRKSMRRHGVKIKIVLLSTLMTPLFSLAFTAVAVYYVSRAPFKVDWDNDKHRHARLVARNGNVLAEWTAGRDGSLLFAEGILTQPGELGGRRLALIGIGIFGATKALKPDLSAFDVDGDLKTPLWHNCVQDEDIPAVTRENRGFVGAEYGLARAILADIFLDRPCPQVVAAFQNEYTHTSLRVIDLAGKVLSEVWVDTSVSAMYWMSGPGLLVILGLNGEVLWEERGKQSSVQAHPFVLFALRPFPGRLREYVIQEGDPPPGTDPALVPAWYHCLMLGDDPPPTSVLLGRLDAPRARWPAASFVNVSVNFDASYPPLPDPAAGAGVSWVFDASGSVADGPRPGDQYQQNQQLRDGDQRKLPPAEAWKWGPLPKRLPHVPPGPSVWKPGDNKRPATGPATTAPQAGGD